MLGLKETTAKRDQATQDQNLPSSRETPQETKPGKFKLIIALKFLGFFGQEF